MASDDSHAALAAQRKDDHISLAAAQTTPPHSDFDDVEFVHHALAGIDASRVAIDVDVAGWAWPAPLYINGMTGGTERATSVNRALAIAAREANVPMASGSAGVAVDDARARAGFRVIREQNPNGIVIANLGAGRGPDDALRAIELLEADALQIHLNAVQETIMPEGSRAFSSWVPLLERVVAASPVPVIVKEVGFGLSRRTLETLHDIGVRVADVSGTGGTDFARIENARREDADYDYLAGFGQSTVSCLVDARGALPAMLASGGVRSPLDVLKALALGATAVGVAGEFLRAALESEARAVERVTRWRAQLVDLLALVGAPTPADLTSSDVLLRGRVREFCELRGLDAGSYARRTGAARGNAPVTPHHASGIDAARVAPSPPEEHE